MKRIIFIFCLYTSFSYSENLCGDISTSDQVYSCSVNKKEQADKYLNEQYSYLVSRIKVSYANDSVLKKQYLNIVKEAQRSWLVFRDSNCELYAFQIETNSPAHKAVINECVAKMSEQRGKDLKEIAGDI